MLATSALAIAALCSATATEPTFTRFNVNSRTHAADTLPDEAESFVPHDETESECADRLRRKANAMKGYNARTAKRNASHRTN